MLLSERISLMIRGGYVGRNPNTGKLQQHLQNGYERLQTRDLMPNALMKLNQLLIAWPSLAVQVVVKRHLYEEY
jgi:hypothetical protein